MAGRGGQKQRGGGGRQPHSSEYWQYWPGAWKSPRQRTYGWDEWQQEPPTPAFPAYDGKSRASALKKEISAETMRKPQWLAGQEEDPGAMMTAELQEQVNLTRKAEQRVRSLAAARKQKDALWAKWQEDMKQSYLKESTRYHKAIGSLDKDLAQAVAAREEARQNIRAYIQNGGAPANMQEDDVAELDWDGMTSRWRQEQREVEAPRAILQRAMQTQAVPPASGAAGTPAPLTAGAWMTPDAAARLFMAAMGGQMCMAGTAPPNLGTEHGTATLGQVPPPAAGDPSTLLGTQGLAPPYPASPSAHKAEAATSSPAPAAKATSATRPRVGQRHPIKGAPLQPVHTQVPGKLADKLNAKRSVLQSEETTLDIELNQTRNTSTGDHGGVGGHGASAAIIPDDDDDLHSSDSPPDATKALDGMG